MGIEIERKFLTASERWRALVQRREIIRDGLVAASDDRKTRVRIVGARATLAVKTKRIGGQRHEFEYEIPVPDAERLMECCGPKVLEKVRHYIPVGEVVWEVDEYRGLLQGVILAEVELTAIHQRLDIPEWIGQEVTTDPSYRKINMLRATSRWPIDRPAAENMDAAWLTL